MVHAGREIYSTTSEPVAVDGQNRLMIYTRKR